MMVATTDDVVDEVCIDVDPDLYSQLQATELYDVSEVAYQLPPLALR